MDGLDGLDGSDDEYLPIAAEAEAASWTALESPAGSPGGHDAPDNLPAPVESGGPIVAEPDTPAVPHVAGVTDLHRAAVRWIRPLVPTFVARAIDTTTQPLRAARQVFEEVEEINFSLKRTRKVSVRSEESLEQPRQRGSAAGSQREPSESSWVESEDRPYPDHRPIEAAPQRPPLGRMTGRRPAPALLKRDGPGELDAPDGPLQLPPTK